GTEEAYRRLKRLSALLGAEQNIALFVGPTAHGYTQENREAMYRWFNRITRVSAAMAEPKLVIEKEATLWCTPRGQVADLKSRTVFSFTQEKSQALAHKRPRLADRELKQTVAALLHLPVRSGVPEFRILRAVGARQYPRPHATTYAVETERGIFALVYRLSELRLDSRPPRDRAPAILYVAHHSSDAELRTEPLIAELLRDEPRSVFYTCDVRGIGES